MKNGRATGCTERTDFDGKQIFVVDLSLNPVHQQLSVLRRRQLGRPLVRHAVAPVVLVSSTTSRQLSRFPQFYQQKNLALSGRQIFRKKSRTFQDLLEARTNTAE